MRRNQQRLRKGAGREQGGNQRESAVPEAKGKVFQGEKDHMCQMWLRGQVVINIIRSVGISLQRLFKLCFSAYIRRVLEKGFHSFK